LRASRKKRPRFLSSPKRCIARESDQRIDREAWKMILSWRIPLVIFLDEKDCDRFLHGLDS
jgi:hypothetical protein